MIHPTTDSQSSIPLSRDLIPCYNSAPHCHTHMIEPANSHCQLQTFCSLNITFSSAHSLQKPLFTIVWPRSTYNSLVSTYTSWTMTHYNHSVTYSSRAHILLLSVHTHLAKPKPWLNPTLYLLPAYSQTAEHG